MTSSRSPRHRNRRRLCALRASGRVACWVSARPGGPGNGRWDASTPFEIPGSPTHPRDPGAAGCLRAGAERSGLLGRARRQPGGTGAPPSRTRRRPDCPRSRGARSVSPLCGARHRGAVRRSRSDCAAAAQRPIAGLGAARAVSLSTSMFDVCVTGTDDVVRCGGTVIAGAEGVTGIVGRRAICGVRAEQGVVCWSPSGDERGALTPHGPTRSLPDLGDAVQVSVSDERTLRAPAQRRRRLRAVLASARCASA